MPEDTLRKCFWEVMLIKSVLLLLGVVVLAGCTQIPDTPYFQPSSNLPTYKYDSFQSYQEETRKWLMENRAFITTDKTREVDANAPFELKPRNAGKVSKGILLVHGLADSPYSFVDVAQALADKGFLVRTLLLSGHGSRPADLLQVDISDWEGAVKHHTQLLQEEVDEVWLGGFSTGANLVTTLASDDSSIKGLLLFAPAYRPKSRLIALAPFVAKFADWADADPADNYVRYDSLTFKAAGEYYKSVQRVNRILDKEVFDRPALILLSADDSVVDTAQTLRLFEQRFTNPNSRLVWYGKEPDSEDNRVRVLSSYVPEQRISNFSHMALLFSPDNPHYGINGEYRMCTNGQAGEREGEVAPCPPTDQLWYSAYGYREQGKIHARLTWNPHFEQMIATFTTLTKQ